MATVDHEQVRVVAAHLAAKPPKSAGLNFYSFHTPGGEMVADQLYPPLNHPQAVDFFFLACLYQFGFWYGDDLGYVSRMRVSFEGKLRSGSETIWRLLRRQLERDPGFFSPAQLAEVTPEELSGVLALPDGYQWPDFESRFALTRRYGRWLTDGGMTPGEILSYANQREDPLATFLDIVSQGPFGDDQLRKKQILLAMALANRPEHFLSALPTSPTWRAVIDYHVMRILLRLGVVRLSPREAQDSMRRHWVSAECEEAIRSATFYANQELIRLSGLTMAVLDELLWGAGRFCPDYKQPDCGKCVFNSVCLKRTELYQPVFRTTAY